MNFLFAAPYSKPSSLKTTNKDENPQYHADMAKYCITNSGFSLQSTFVERTKLNKRFYKGDQWFLDEDLETFLKDENNNERNRIQIVHNIIRPMIEQYRGNAIRISISAAAKPISPKSINRREMALEEKLFLTDLANELGSFNEYIKQNYHIGKDRTETKSIFDNLYVDTYASAITDLMKYISTIVNDFQNDQIKVAENLGLSGLASVYAYEHGGHLRYQIMESERRFWDRSARRYDLNDASWKGHYDSADPVEFYERWPDLTDAQRQAIENYVIQSGTISAEFGNDNQMNPSKVPYYTVFWKDQERFEMAYVMDEFGYPYLTKINYTYPGEDKPRYTDKDIIEPPKSNRNKRLFGSKNKRFIRLDVLRYCILIPSDILEMVDKNDGFGDVVLEYGMYPWQDTCYEDPVNVGFPYMDACWGYIDGEVLAPVDDAIDSNRLINRILSVAESQINQSGGANSVIDRASIDAQDGESAVLSDIAAGKPLIVNTKGRGIPNMVGAYDATPKAGTYKMFDFVTALKGLVQDTTGVNEALKGESTGQDQLVGVTQLLLQRGSLMQEPFYYAIESVFMQMFRYAANVGKRIYIDSEREIAIAIGDEPARAIKLSNGMNLEDFRIAIVRENVNEILQASADQMLLTLQQLKLIDETTFANLYSRSTPSEVGRFLRQNAKNRIEVARKEQEQNVQDEATLMQRIQGMQAQQNEQLAFQNAQKSAAKMAEDNNIHENNMREIVAQGVMKGSGQSAG